ncbi:FadR/GntR family transcriptional regulator [Rhodococcus pyridinivorans]|uniref:FadR/GntR family transcriptional regulator n=1 Tax=Rhodococcus TaxID=1827 RepID=UPI001C7CBAF8|nr:FCD domain-containing protein [Rhodococcus sp. DMU2021]MBX4171488.1 FCD domain-containing protein [Rhodococcus sp. DMU2021]
MPRAVFEELKRPPAYRTAELAIRAKILDGTLAPGSLLPPEHDLAEQLGVTRPTVREALRALESSGLLARGPRRRMAITAPDAKVTTNAMHEAIVLHGISYRELWEVNSTLEPLAAKLAAEHAGAALIARIGENLQRTADCLDDPSALVSADIEFHDLVAQAAGNHALLLAREPLADLLIPAYEMVIRRIGPGRRLFEAHSRIFSAVRDGDAATAEEWMSKHLVDFRRGLELAGLDLATPVKASSPQKPHSD